MHLDQRGLYPYEPPKTLIYRLPSSASSSSSWTESVFPGGGGGGFPIVAALTAALWRRSAEISGEPQLYSLLQWLRESGAGVIDRAVKRMAKVRARMGFYNGCLFRFIYGTGIQIVPMIQIVPITRQHGH